MRRLLVLMMVLGCLQASAQLAVHNFTTEDGLPSNNVYCVFSDREGFLWFGTDNGVARFDGKHFKVLTSADGLADNEVFGFFQDSHDRLWLRSFSGRACYLAGGKIFTSANDSTLAPLDFRTYVYSITEFHDTLFFTGESGEIGRYHAGKSTIEYFGSWMTLVPTSQRLYAVNYMELCDIHSNSVVSSYYVEKFLPTRGTQQRDTIYFTGDFDIFALSLAKPGPPKSILHSDSHFFFLENERDTALLIGGEKGAYRLHPQTGRVDTLLLGFPVSHIAHDFEGGLWVTTLNKGIFYFGNTKSKLLGLARPGNPHREYLFGTFPLDSQWFCLGQNGDITYLEVDHERSIRHSAWNRTSGRITSYFWMSPDSLFITGERIGALFRPSLERFEPTQIAANFKLVLPVGLDSVLFSTGSAYYHYSRLEFLDMVFYQPPARSTGLMRLNCSEKFQGHLLLGTNDGVQILVGSELQKIGPDNQLLRDRVTTMTATPDGKLWVGLVNQGIALLDGENATILSDLFKIVNVRKVRMGPDGSLWACNHEGAFKFSKKPNGEYVRESFTPAFGYPIANAWDILPKAGFAYAATEQGLIRFESLPNLTPPRLIVEDVRYGDQPIDRLGIEAFEGDHPGKRLKVRFAGLSFRNNGQLTYRYRIAQIDGDWQTTSVPEIEYADMRPGIYKLELKAIGTTGLESPIFQLQFSVAPYFWQTIWFLILSFLVMAAVVVVVYRWRVSRLQIVHQREQEKSRKEIERIEAELYVRELEQKAMRLQMNPHFIFNALNTIQGLYANKDIPKAKEYINKLSVLIREILEQSGHSLISLGKEIEVVSSYLDVTLYRFENLFTYSVFVARDIRMDKISVPPLILQPIVENAVIHGIAPKGGNGRIEIRVEREGSDIVIRIRDNGVGIHYSQAHKHSAPGRTKSKGMKLTKERLHQHWQDRPDGFVVEELIGENQEIAGTMVTIRLAERLET